MKLGNNIRTLRQRKGMTQEQVAAYLGVSYQAVSKWETGVNTPDISLLPALAKLFEVQIDTLFSSEALPQDGPFMWEDDDVIRIIQMRGKQFLAVTPVISPDCPPVEIAFPRNCNERTQYFKVEVYGHIMTDGSINGDVVCHHSIQCLQINGDVHAAGDIQANEVTSCGNIVCSHIENCYQLQANSINCSGDIQAANLNCNQITKNN